MKTAQFIALLAAGSLTLATLAPTAQAQAKTREQVRQELMQARHNGTLENKARYPSTADTIARAKQVHAAAIHRGESMPSVDSHDKY
jgi:hypothetical protein